MVKDEVYGFLRSENGFSTVECTALINTITAENTVASFAWCGETVGVSFLSKNFTKIFGYPSHTFADEGIDFILSRVHPEDLSAFLQFIETSHTPPCTWFESHDAAGFEISFRFKHYQGHWIWICEKIIVLSVTAEGFLDHAFLTFTDITDLANRKEKEKMETLTHKKSKLAEAWVKYKSLQKEKNSLSSCNGHVLTEREKQVLELVSKGYSSKQIAHHLFISRHTVESHRKHLLRKLNVSNAAELVVKANVA